MAAFVNFSVHFLIVFIFLLILATLATSNGSNNKYKSCSTLISCGKLQNIGYPFWGLGRPQYCGHPALQLHCPNNQSSQYPVLKNGSLKHYYVKGISNKNSSMIIQLQDISWTNRFCAFNISNEFDDIFQTTGNVKEIKLFYKCPKKYAPQNHSITCKNEKTEITAYYLPKPNNSELQQCVFATVPVLSEELNLLNQGQKTLWDVLKKGYEVSYLYSARCDECQLADRICGSSNYTDFVCFQNHHKSGPSKKLTEGIVILGAFFMLAALNVCFCCCMKPKFQGHIFRSKRLYSHPMHSNIETVSSFCGIPVFSYNELQEATNNFNAAQEIGRGSFGIVYFGKLRDGREVAIKRLYEKNHKQIGQFINEIMIFTRLSHQNLVKLYGCTSRHSWELLLVYEFIPKGTVADHLHGNRKVYETLSWTMRMKIATETATALTYLHASDIIHRDVKTNNILLDENFSVKVADLGLSRLSPVDATHVSTAPQGTPGYLDPSYNKCYKVTNKSDVYSFGVVLVELISSLPAVDTRRKEDEINLSDYAMKRIQHGALHELVDRKLLLVANFIEKKMIKLVAELAFQCLQQDKDLRPSMDEVLKALKQIESTDSDYESTNAKDMESSKKSSKQNSAQQSNDIKPNSTNFQHLASPNSVMENWTSKSTASNTSA